MHHDGYITDKRWLTPREPDLAIGAFFRVSTRIVVSFAAKVLTPQPPGGLRKSLAARFVCTKKVTMSNWKKGDFVEFDGLPAVVVGIEGDPDVPEEHIALWFGDPKAKRKSKGGSGNVRPEVWTVPEEYCLPSQEPIYKH